MLLTTLKQYLKHQPPQSLFALSQRFQVQADIMRAMLAILVRKGQVKKCPKTARCGIKCQACATLTTEMYEWNI